MRFLPGNDQQNDDNESENYSNDDFVADDDENDASNSRQHVEDGGSPQLFSPAAMISHENEQEDTPQQDQLQQPEADAGSPQLFAASPVFGRSPVAFDDAAAASGDGVNDEFRSCGRWLGMDVGRRAEEGALSALAETGNDGGIGEEEEEDENVETNEEGEAREDEAREGEARGGGKHGQTAVGAAMKGQESTQDAPTLGNDEQDEQRRAAQEANEDEDAMPVVASSPGGRGRAGAAHG